MPNYTHATLQNALDALAARLYDVNYQQWTQAELTGYLVEALRNWNALTSFWTDDMQFTLTPNVQWYDLTAQPGTLIPYTVSQNDLIVQIENHLLEPPTSSYPLTWTGTSQFSVTDLLSALNQRESETLGESGCTLTRSVVPGPQRRVILPDNVIDIRRVAYMPASTGPARPMRQSDLWANRAFSPNYLSPSATPNPPSTWIANSTPPPSFDVDTLPLTAYYEVLTVNSDALWTATANSILSIPSDWAWVVKWGALFSLMSREMWAQDPLRMDYCLKRFREGITYLMNLPRILGLIVNGVPFSVDALRDADDYRPLWQNAVPGAPTNAYTAGNLLAFGPTPDSATTYSVTATVAENAPVPALLADFVQVERDDYDTVLDYAQHLALFKTGGQEFAATVPLYQKFQEKASLYNGKLKEFGFFTLSQLDISEREEHRNPRYQKGSEPKAA